MKKFVLFLALTVAVFASRALFAESVKDFDGKRIGVFTGAVHAQTVNELWPHAELFYFESNANIIAALTSGKIDAMVQDDTLAREFERDNPSLTHLEEYLKTFDNAFVFAKNPESDKLRSEINEFITSIKADGTLKNINDVWFGDDESAKIIPDYARYPDTNGTVKIAVDSESPPFVYIKDRKTVGYEVDIMARFCKAKGYKPKFLEVSFPAIIPSVVSGKCDVGLSSITITAERAQSVNFSEPVYTGGSVIVVRKSSGLSSPLVRGKPAIAGGGFTSPTKRTTGTFKTWQANGSLLLQARHTLTLR